MTPSGYLQRPDYRVDVLRRRNRFQARCGEVKLAASDRALVVDDQDHGLMVYFPREAVAFDRLVAMAGCSTHCLYKGDARYWAAPDAPDVPIAWSYETPFPEVAAITGYVAFYADRVTVTIGDPDQERG